MVNTYDLRRMLRGALEDAAAAGRTLPQQLAYEEKLAGSRLAAGQIASTSKNTASVSFAFDARAVSTGDLARGWTVLCDLWDTCAAALGSTDDATVYAEMMSRLQPIHEFTKDFQTVTA